MDPPANLTGVIVADDDPMIRSVLRASLESIGLSVFVAYDGLEAVLLASRIQAALIILDLRMPKLNGLLACQRIRTQPNNGQTPIVILTSLPADSARMAATICGATEFHMKPFRTALFMQALSRFLPLDEPTREMIRCHAESVHCITEAVPRPVDYGATEPSDVIGPLDIGKFMLDILRG